MRIYAIRDRMLDYFQPPFCAPGDKEVLAAMAQRLNVTIPGDQGDAIKQAPHHFELWKLGEVTQEGHITAALDFLADCSSLIRGGVREGDTEEPAHRAAPRPAGGRDRAPTGGEHATRANGGPVPHQGAPTPGQAPETLPRSPGGN